MTGLIQISLNGEWEYILDSNDKFTYEEIKAKFNHCDINGKMNLPINWELAGLHNYSGSVWFKRQIYISDKEITENGYIEFNGVDYECEVFFNNFAIGKNIGYFNKFDYSLQDKVLINEINTVIIKVTSPKEKPEEVWPNKKNLIKGIFGHHDCRPGGWSLEYGQDRNTGGVWNDINMFFTKVPRPYIEITTDYDVKSNEGILNLSIEIDANNISSVEINAALWYKGKHVTEQVIEYKFENNTADKIKWELSLPNPQLWSTWDIGEPNLYEVIISSSEFGSYCYTIGFKNVYETEKRELYLNGKRLFLRGTNIIPEQMLSNLTNEKISKIVEYLKGANINAVRVHAHVNRQELYDAFDKEGILVWQDFALQWTYNNSIHFINAATEQIGRMVRMLKHHPCIVYWCCHNEPGYESNNLDEALYREVEANDKTRIIKLYSNYEEHPYYGWYWGIKDEYVAAPMGPLVTEFGAQGIPNYETLIKFMTKDEVETPDWDKWIYHNYQYEQTNLIAKVPFGSNVKEYIENSQSYQSELLATAIKSYRIKKYKPITGIFQFMFIDCWESITWSVVDYYGSKKKGYYTLQKMYSPFVMFVNKRQNEYMIDSFLNVDVDIVNDLYGNYKNLELKVFVDEKEIKRIESITIPEDDMIHIDWELLKVPLKEYFRIGINRIKFILYKNEEKITEEEVEINVFDKKLYWGNK